MRFAKLGMSSEAIGELYPCKGSEYRRLQKRLERELKQLSPQAAEGYGERCNTLGGNFQRVPQNSGKSRKDAGEVRCHYHERRKVPQVEGEGISKQGDVEAGKDMSCSPAAIALNPQARGLCSNAGEHDLESDVSCCLPTSVEHGTRSL